MSNNISPVTAVKPNIPAPNVQNVQPVKIDEPKQDAFVKSNKKATGIAMGGVATGGIIGILKEKLNPKNVPEEIINEYDSSNLDNLNQIASKKANEILDKEAHMLKTTTYKMLDNKELTKEEIEFVNNSGIILPEDVKYLVGENSPLYKFIKNEVSGDISNSGKYFDNISSQYSTSGLTGGQETWLATKDRIEDFLTGGHKYNDSEEFLDYMTSKFYKGIKFRIEMDKDANTLCYVMDGIEEPFFDNSFLSNETYTYKEMIKHAKAHGKTTYAEVASSATIKNPVEDYLDNVQKRALKEAKVELEHAKDVAIKNFQNKGVLKSAGIGALIVGIVALGGSLISNKMKKDK